MTSLSNNPMVRVHNPVHPLKRKAKHSFYFLIELFALLLFVYSTQNIWKDQHLSAPLQKHEAATYKLNQPQHANKQESVSISNIALVCTTITEMIKESKLLKKQAACHSHSGKIAVMNQQKHLGDSNLCALLLEMCK